jgi:GntR family transcriptional regulator/MocR family aminotransferase
MSLERRMSLLKWAADTGAVIIEDDYDSEFRFGGPPIGALHNLDRSSSVIFIGSFNKLLFPSLRIGYVVLPPSLVDISRARYRGFSQLARIIPCQYFIVDGHLGRHLRRMRELYASRLAALVDGSKQYLKGMLEISEVRAGLYTAAFLKNGMNSWQAEKAAATHEIEVTALDRYTLRAPDPNGVLLGFAAFDEATIRAGLIKLAAALSH